MRQVIVCLVLIVLFAAPVDACIPAALVWANEPAQNNIEPEKQGFWASCDPWTKEDTYWQIGVLVTLIIDWGQTREIATNPAYYETNPILGKYPTLQEVDRYFIACIIGNYLIAKALPKNWRKAWQIGSILVQTYYINNNYKLGIKINF